MNKTLSNYTLMLCTTTIVKDANFSHKKKKIQKENAGWSVEKLAAVWHCSKVTRVFSQLAIGLLNRRLQTQCYPLLLFKTSTTIEKSRRPYSGWSSHLDRGWIISYSWFCFFYFCPALSAQIAHCILGNFSAWTRHLHSNCQVIRAEAERTAYLSVLYLSLDTSSLAQNWGCSFPGSQPGFSLWPPEKNSIQKVQNREWLSCEGEFSRPGWSSRGDSTLAAFYYYQRWNVAGKKNSRWSSAEWSLLQFHLVASFFTRNVRS